MVLEARPVVSAVFPAFLIFVSFLPQTGNVKIMRPHLRRWPWENLGVSRCMLDPRRFQVLLCKGRAVRDVCPCTVGSPSLQGLMELPPRALVQALTIPECVPSPTCTVTPSISVWLLLPLPSPTPVILCRWPHHLGNMNKVTS